jgi:glucose/arabinose dehydrogenase
LRFQRWHAAVAAITVLMTGLLVPSLGQVAAQEVSSDPLQGGHIETRLFVDGLDNPVAVTHAPDGSGRLFVVEKKGTIRVVHGRTLEEQPFLTLPLDQSRVARALSKQGLLSVVFHPRYAENGYFYVYYSDPTGASVISRFTVSADNPDVADPTSEKVILYQPQTTFEHYGGDIAFGPDGDLWIAFGDGGAEEINDPAGNAQNPQTWLGKVVRIDVDNGDPYTVPADNPFVGNPDVLPEIWAFGLRNPWRWSFDRQTGDLWIGDVGLSNWEEVDTVPSSPGGYNFGWGVMEGMGCYADEPCDPSPYTPPVFVYSHGSGCAITGGYVYRGEKFPLLNGVYLFSDFCRGTMRGLWPQPDGTWQGRDLLSPNKRVTAMGEDEGGELYFTTIEDGSENQGRLYRLVLQELEEPEG